MDLIVSILVMLDDALVHYNLLVGATLNVVSILVMLDDALVLARMRA